MTADVALPRVFEPFAADPGAAGVFTDFDGTLAPIVEVPEDARPLDGSVEVSERVSLQIRE